MKNRSFGDYWLEELKQIHTNKSQLWTVRHKEQNTLFTLKKIKCRSNSLPNDCSQQSSPPHSDDQYKKLVNQSNLLKRLNAQFAPKCLKLLKTSNNCYIVFQQFPPITLKGYLNKPPLKVHQKNILLQKLTLAVMQMHNQKAVNLSLNQNSIYIKVNLDVFFGDWSLSKSIPSKEKIVLSQNELMSQFIPMEVKQQGIYGEWSDIYSLGKIFKTIQSCCIIKTSKPIAKRMETLINNMTNPNYNQRPNIKEVLITLGNISSQKQSKISESNSQHKFTKESKQNSKFSVWKAASLQEDEMYLRKQSQLKSIKSVDLLQSQKIMTKSKSKFFSTQQTQNMSSKTNSKNQSSNTKYLIEENTTFFHIKKTSSFPMQNDKQSIQLFGSNKKNQNTGSINQKILKIINKNRGLSFLLNDLAYFVLRTQSSLSLGFLLLKYSLLNYRQSMLRWKNQKNCTTQGNLLTQLMEREILSIQIVVSKIKDRLKEQAKSRALLKREIDMPHLINDKFLREQIIEFSKRIFMNSQNKNVEKQMSAHLIDELFKTYLILKKVQEGSYEKFWDKISNESVGLYASQKYLRDQKSLGIRYLKSRIAEIITLK